MDDIVAGGKLPAELLEFAAAIGAVQSQLGIDADIGNVTDCAYRW